MMRKSLIALAAGMIVTGTGAAVAQYTPPADVSAGWDAGAFWRGAPDGPRERIQFLQDRIDRGIADGSLDRREGFRANRELANIRRWIRQMHYDDAGRLGPQQRADVQARLDGLSRQIRWMRHDGW